VEIIQALLMCFFRRKLREREKRRNDIGEKNGFKMSLFAELSFVRLCASPSEEVAASKAKSSKT
jgi:hypothetical protein